VSLASAVARRWAHLGPWVKGIRARTRRVLRLSLLALWRGIVGVYDSSDLTHAAAIAYYALLSLFPCLLLAISILGMATADEESRTRTLDFVLRYFPTQFEFVTHQLDALRRARIEIGIAGFVALTWASLGVFGAVSTAIDHAWRVERQRSYLKHKLVSFLMLLAAGALLLITLVLVSAAQIVGASWFAGVASRYPWLMTLRSVTVSNAATLALIIGVGLVFYFLPNAKVRFRDVWVGAILTGLLWRAAFEGFAWFVRDMSRFNVHGSIGAVVAFLLWVYVSAVILLYGAEFTAAYSRARRHRPEQAPAAPAPRV
jgi:membrane protein